MRSKRSHPFLLAILGLTLLLAPACDDDATQNGGTPDVETDIEPDIEIDAGLDNGDMSVPVYPTVGVLARFDLTSSLEESFYDFPWPSNLRADENGVIDLTTFPTDAAVGTLLTDFVGLTEEHSSGYSNVTAVYFTFEDTLDETSLPAGWEEATDAEASAYIIDIDADSPWYGRRHPINVHYREDAGAYWDAHTVVLQPLYGFPLRADTLYAAVVTTNVVSEDGWPAYGPQAFVDVLNGQADDDLTNEYAPLLDTLSLLNTSPYTMAAATVFTTSAPAMEMRRLRQWIRDTLPTPAVENVFLASDGYRYDVYEGTFPFEEFQDGTPPFRRFGEGTVSIGDDGEPDTRKPVDLRFALSIPPGPMPADGWPVLIYHHGTGGDYLSFTRNATAREMARRGVAVLGLDQPLHGERNPTQEDELDLITSLSVSNLVASAGMVSQGVADLFQATRLVRAGIVVSGAISSTGEEIRTDPSRVAFMGHSQGAQTGALFLGVEDDITTGLLSEGGGGAAVSAILRKDNDIDIEAILSVVLGLNTEVERLEVYHPIFSCVAQPLFDVVDPLSYARHIMLEPLAGDGHNLVMTIGYQDAATPPPGIEALASTAGLPIAEPVYTEIESMQIQGIGTVALPASENLPESNGFRPTGALLQFPGRNHYLVSRDTGAQYQVYEFLHSALMGTPTIYPAEDRK